MSGQKIKSITIKGFRGIKNQILLPLSEKSTLFYGDNGTGKSSIADAIEWFYKDDVAHLASKEIDKSSLRNFTLPEQESASVQLAFTTSNLGTDKTLSIKKKRLLPGSQIQHWNFSSTSTTQTRKTSCCATETWKSS